MLSAVVSFVGTAYTTRDAAAATAQVIAVPAALLRVNITTAGTTAVTFYDNSAGDTSGSILAALPATTTVGQTFDFQVPAALGISASGAAGTPAYTLTYAVLGNN